MKDQYGRTIDYMRVSITDRCNLRCRYCMPEGIALASHSDILSYEELLLLCRAAVSVGIVKFKVTGGEPLVRKGCVDFITRLKAIPGVEQVSITTNGLLLPDHLDDLCAAGIDGVNISLDTLDQEEYCKLTGYSGEAVALIEEMLTACVARGLRVKVNAVLLQETFAGIADIAMLAYELLVDVRFIELMPISEGAAMQGILMETVLARLREDWPDLRPIGEKRGNGPARYYASDFLQGRIGFINAVSRQFCADCNRVRLTATGILKPCLCYEDGADFGCLLRGGYSFDELCKVMVSCIRQKPKAHCFSILQNITEHKTMSQIGG